MDTLDISIVALLVIGVTVWRLWGFRPPRKSTSTVCPSCSNTTTRLPSGPTTCNWCGAEFNVDELGYADCMTLGGIVGIILLGLALSSWPFLAWYFAWDTDWLIKGIIFGICGIVLVFRGIWQFRLHRRRYAKK